MEKDGDPSRKCPAAFFPRLDEITVSAFWRPLPPMVLYALAVNAAEPLPNCPS